MKRTPAVLAMIMALMMLFQIPGAFAEETLSLADELYQTIGERPTQEELGYDEFVIGATTTLSGTFFTNMWGNNTSDIDVRSLIHGYSPVVWTMQSRFDLNHMVIENVAVMETEDGAKQFLVQLKTNLTYNDGTPITAKDYLFSMMLFADPEINKLGAISTNSGYIEGYEAYLSGESKVFSGLRLVDEYTYVVNVKAEYLPFFFEISMIDAIPYPISVIAPGCEVADDGEGVYIRNIDQSIEEPIWNAEFLAETILDPDTGYLSHPTVTSGPYMLTGFDWETRIATFDLNPAYIGYYDGTIPTINHLVLKTVTPEDMIQRFEAGEIHLLNKVVYKQNIDDGLAKYATGEFGSTSYPRMGAGFLSFSCEQGPMQFEAVRKAIAYSFDREAFRQSFIADYGVDVHGYYGFGQWMFQMIVTQTVAPPVIADQAEQDEWDALKLQNIQDLEVYTTNLEKAKTLLIEDGWTLNEKGEAFKEGMDAVRYKKLEDGTLMGLNLRYAQIKDSVAAQQLLDMLTGPLTDLGMSVEATVLPMEELFLQYYRQEERAYDMMYIATNFISIFDPYFVVNTGDEYQGTQNTTGIRDEELMRLAFELRSTPSGDLLEYCKRWVKFQDRFNEILPMLPLYSNLYFDFFVNDLQVYAPDSEMNWPVAILYAYLGEPIEVVAEEGLLLDGDEETGSGGMLFLD